MHHATARWQGFTLLEVMVVMLLVAVMAAIAVPNLFAGKSRGKDLEREASVLLVRLQTAQDDAMLYGEEYGLVFSADGYRFVRWNEKNYRFEALSPEKSWGLRRFENAVTVSALADVTDPILVLPEKPENETGALEKDTSEAGSDQPDKKGDEPDWQPSVYVLSSGEVTPFRAVFGTEGSDEKLELQIDPLGNRVLPKVAPKDDAPPAMRDRAHAS